MDTGWVIWLNGVLRNDIKHIKRKIKTDRVKTVSPKLIWSKREGNPNIK